MFPNNVFSATSATMTRPADTTAYAIGDLIANSTTAGSVVPIVLSDVTKGPGFGARVTRIRLWKSSGGVTSANIRIHLWEGTAPTVGNGDNGVVSLTSGAASYRGSYDVTSMVAFSDGGAGFVNCDFAANSGTFHILLEARGTYTPASGEQFRVTFEGQQQ